MKAKNRSFLIPIILSFLVPLTVSPVLAEDSVGDLDRAGQTIRQSMAQLGVNKNDQGILLLTNAYYGQVNGGSAEQYRDLLSDITGCTSGKRSLLDVHTAFNEALWFALWQKTTNKVVFSRLQGGTFQSQTIDAAPEKLLDVKSWKQASDGLIGARTLFQVVSIGLAWSAGTDWQILKVAGFHDSIAPGVNMGYLFHSFLEKRMPGEKGEEWLFFGAVPKCYMDTLQIMYGATLGNMRAFGVSMSPDQLNKYKTKGAMPCIVALKVNRSKDLCQGVVLGFSRKRVMDDLGVREADLNPKGGDNNPVFCIARIRGCMQMAKLKTEDQVKWIVEIRRFSGAASLAESVCNAGGDPYAVVWAK
ncbi:MAG: hypothetical protein V1792_04495 [Pseudomonadota bacterium]